MSAEEEVGNLHPTIASLMHALVMISFSTMSSRAVQIILPLSSTKTRQEMDESDDEIDDLYDDAFKSTSGLSGIQSSDPQYIMSSEANEAKRELVINIPNIFFESTTPERQQLSNLLSNTRLGENDSEASNNKPTPTDSSHLHGKDLRGTTFNVGQISVVLHDSKPNDSNSYSLIMDKI